MEVVTEAVECPDCGGHVARQQGHASRCGHCGATIPVGGRGEVVQVVYVWPPSEVREVCARFPEVQWDRALPGPGQTWTVYGWIEREHGELSHDFIVLEFDSRGLALVTSSAKHSRAFFARIGGKAEQHTDCVSVADALGIEPQAT